MMSLIAALRLSRLHLSLICIVCVLVTSSVSGRRQRQADHEERHVTGEAGKSIVLQCDLPVTSPPSVRWIDYVYNTGPQPELIFDGHTVRLTHPNANKFRVNSAFSLTISSLRVDQSPGQYVCQSTVRGRTHQLVYQLTVYSLPRCSGVTHVDAGDTTSLACEASYAGNDQPQLNWYKQVHRRHRLFDDVRPSPTAHGHPVNSFDEFDIGVARQVVRLPTHHSDDGAVYTCQMTLAGMTQQCNLTLNVTYLVKDVKFRPRDNHVAVDDEIKCHARGNPTPRISISPQMTSETAEGSGWKSFRVPAQFEGREMAVVCSATNEVNGVSETVSQNRTFHVAERRPDKHDHVNPNQHPPMHDASDTQNKPAVGQQSPSENSRNAGETWRRVEHSFIVAASLLSLVMIQ